VLSSLMVSYLSSEEPNFLYCSRACRSVLCSKTSDRY
jgi:hypothetical protein